MKRLLMVLFAPFALVGGALIGYYSHAIRLAETFSYTDILNYPYLLGGVALVLLGGLVRHRLVVGYEAKIKELGLNIHRAEKALELSQGEVRKLQQRVGWVEDLVQKATHEQSSNMLLEAPPSDYVKEE